MKIRFTEATELFVLDDYDIATDQATSVKTETFREGEEVEVEITNDGVHVVDIQFGDGSMVLGLAKTSFVQSEFRVELPRWDADVIIVFPGGEEMVIQARPSNADVNHNGSLDIILPTDQVVTAWKGDDMEHAPARAVFAKITYPEREDREMDHVRVAKQLAMNLPGNYDDTPTFCPQFGYDQAVRETFG